MKPTVTIEFFKLKQATRRVLDFAEKFVQEKNMNLRTSIAEDLSLVELEGYVFLDQFQSEFNLRLPESVYDYVTPASLKAHGPKKIMYTIVMFLFSPLFLLLYPFIPKDRREKVKAKIRYNKKRLTLGDLAATVAAGYFVKREEVIISTTNPPRER